MLNMFFAMMVSAVMAAEPTPTPSAESANLLGWVSIGATTIVGLFSTYVLLVKDRRKKYSDSRDDKTAENQTLKDAAEIAMQLVTTTVENAQASIALLRDTLVTANNQLDSANKQLASANDTISTLQSIVSTMREDAEHGRDRLAALEVKLAEKTEERNQFESQRDLLAQQVKTLSAELMLKEAAQAETEQIIDTKLPHLRTSHHNPGPTTSAIHAVD